MIGTIRKHSTVLWIIVIAATIVCFVVFFSPYQRMSGQGGGSGNYGSINGERISREDLVNAQHEVDLRYFFNYRSWPDAAAQQKGFDLSRETYFRLLMIQKQKQLGIYVSPEAVAKVASQILHSEVLRSLYGGRPMPFDFFVKRILARQGLTAADFERFVRHDLGIQQLMAAYGLASQLITPQEGRLLWERENQDLLAEAVFFSASNYLAGVTVTPGAVAQFFTNQMARYRLPDRVQVKYVEFPATNFMAEAKKQFAEITNLDEIVESKYHELGTNYFPDAKSPAEAKDKIREIMLKNEALSDAQKAATEFARALFDMNPMLPQNLDKFAKQKGLTVHVSEPFDRDYGPKTLNVRADFTKQAFELSDDQPFAEPSAGSDAAYVIAKYKKLPSEIPPFETIRDQVTADYKFSEAVKAAAKAGEAFANTLTNALAKGKKFSVVCNEAKVRPVALPPFSLSTRDLPEVEDHASLNEFKRAAFTTTPSHASDFVPTHEGGFVVFVRERLPLDLAKMNTDLPAFLHSVRQRRENEAFNNWFRGEAEKGLRDTPIFHRPNQTTGTPE
jgi:SurA-like N-terminal domain